MLLQAILLCMAQAQPKAPAYSSAQLEKSARNIVRKVKGDPRTPILVVASAGKRPLAEQIVKEAAAQKLTADLLLLDPEPKPDTGSIEQRIRDAIPLGTILLIDHGDRSLLFKVVGRPDQGIKFPSERFYCDWLAELPATIRTEAVDPEETESFRTKLAGKLRNAKAITITTRAGTRITVQPRAWRTSPGDTNEVFTAPQEMAAEGQIVVDGSAYWGPPTHPILLKIQGGRLTNLSALDAADKQQALMIKDLSADKGAAVLAEFGLGINVEASPQGNVMEAEQARGTCHFGFGRNTEYGGQNRSRTHTDYVLLRPTIWVDGVCICREGEYLF